VTSRRQSAEADLPPLTDARRGERIQRVMADAGVAARRACERLVEEGRVTVNGQTVTRLPVWVDPDRDTVAVDAKPIRRRDRRVYVMLNKPRRTLTTAADEPGALRRTVLDLVDHPAASRLFPVGRLDYDTMGLVLLTNDGELANRLTHPRYGVPKTYRVVVRGLLDDEAIGQLERGIYLAERRDGQTVGAARTAHVELELIRRERDRTILSLTLREGRNRQVRRMLSAVGCPVKRLERVRLGPVKLSGLPRGAWRELTIDEVRSLRKAVRRPEPEQTGEGEPRPTRSDARPSNPRSSARSKPGTAREPSKCRPGTSNGRQGGSRPQGRDSRGGHGGGRARGGRRS